METNKGYNAEHESPKLQLVNLPIIEPATPRIAKPPGEKEILPRGVIWRYNKYQAKAYYNNKSYHLGSFYTAQDAKEAISEFRKTHPLKSQEEISLINTKTQARRKPIIGYSSKYKGVSFCKHRKKYRARIQSKNIYYCLGEFPNTKIGEKKAALAYDKKAKNIWGKDVKHNQYWFPEDFKDFSPTSKTSI